MTYIKYWGATMLLVFLLMGCDPAGTTQMNKLGDLLNNGNGPTMSISQIIDSINTYNKCIKGFDIHFPLTDSDERPLENMAYVNRVTGSKMQFSMSTDDADFSIGTVTIDQKTEGEVSFGNGTSAPSFTKYVQSRGKGVYALYYIPETSDSLTRRIWSRVLLYVYPGADSIMTTRGYAASEHVFYVSTSAYNSHFAQSSYPMSLEKNAVSRLSSILNSSVGHAMSGMELAHQEEKEEIFKVDLPVNETDERPQYGKIYRNEKTGSTILFYDTVIEGDTISPIGTADLKTVIHEWETRPDTTISYSVHARGNGIYTFYNIRHKGCHCIHHDKHPDGFPEYAPCLVYIKPGGKELLITWGYERSKREFKLEEK